MRGVLCVVGLILLLTTLTEGRAFRHPDRKELKTSFSFNHLMNRKQKSPPSLNSDAAGKVINIVKPWSCIILQLFSSLVVNLTHHTLILQLSCICHLQESHALCPQYRAILKGVIAGGITLLLGAASSVADSGTIVAASCGHQTRASGRILELQPGETGIPWMFRDMNMSPGHQAAATGHTSWVVSYQGSVIQLL